ncbi:amidase [Bacillus salacetis]|uniref:Amidase n=1 Tax=Bacillus salacetis TaxID=2315464 RepID=A0A3A1R1Z8_9BACI|nr:amidase family protein [Bacillus salacetis]RIW35091.1 amidase [Bacillus salacetis]
MTIEYEKYDGLGLASLIKNGEVSPVELIESAITRIEELNPSLNAVIHKMYDSAQESLKNLDKSLPFAGVPILLKNAQQEVKGHPMTLGSKILSNYISDVDAEYVTRLKKTGTIILGQTNVPEFALLAVTEPRHYGPTRNPWNLNHTPGGSSGGSAAAVASGMVPMAGGNDGGGSIRIPAAFTGLFGLKPTRGRTPVGPGKGRAWQGASVDHILSKSVRDSAAMLDETHGYERTAAFHAPEFIGSYLNLVNSPLERNLKIAFTCESPLGTPVHAECKKAVLQTVKSLEDMGFEIEEKEPRIDGNRLAESYMTMYFGEVAAALANTGEIIGRKVTMKDVEPVTWLLNQLGNKVTAGEFVQAMQMWDHSAIEMEAFHEEYTFYITPATAYPPSRIGELDQTGGEKMLMKAVGMLNAGGLLKKTGFVDELATKSLERTPFTQLANLSGQPAISLPLHLTEDNLPCGVQVMAARGREDLLFRLAGDLEKSSLWIRR